MDVVQLPEYYSTAELTAMSAEQLRVAQANGFRKLSPAEFAAWQQEQNNPQGGNVEMAVTPFAPPPPAPVQARPAAEVWGANESYEFTCPSGATCRMRKLAPERLVETGMLDKLTRLPGFAQEAIDKAEGKPPAPALSDTESMRSVLAVMQDLIPMIVAEPTITKDPQENERVPGVIYVSSIDLADRLAIMNRALEGVTKLDSFRAEP